MPFPLKAFFSLSQVVVTATDPSMVQLSASDIDSVSLARSLELGLQKTAMYIEGASGADTIEYSFEVWCITKRPTPA